MQPLPICLEYCAKLHTPIGNTILVQYVLVCYKDSLEYYCLGVLVLLDRNQPRMPKVQTKPKSKQGLLHRNMDKNQLNLFVLEYPKDL
jgi:hypothetical protein